VDAQYWNSRHLDRAPTENTVLITESLAYPAVFERKWKAVYLYACSYPALRLEEEKIAKKTALGAGGSVATTAFDFARKLLAPTASTARQGEIRIAGLDLAFPGFRTHFHGALFEENAHTISNRLRPAETASFHALRDGGPFWAEAADEGRVLTDKRLSLYARWFERELAGAANVQSLSQHGLKIAGLGQH
jgi:hypothetical protein